MLPLPALRLLGPLVLAGAAAWAVDALSRRKGLLPPGFRRPWRRAAAFFVVAAVLWIGVFEALGEIGLERKLDFTHVSTPQLFLLHMLMAGAVLAWFLLGFAGVARPLAPVTPAADLAAPLDGTAQALLSPPAPPPISLLRQFAKQFGLEALSLPRELAIGVGLGLAAWGVVLFALVIVAVGVFLVGGQDALPKPSAVVPWIAALPLGIRVLVSLSAGVVEELFFRGFLQPRIGIGLSTAFFVLAHVSYGQPLMLVGITILSLIYALLVRWRQNIWPAIAAHALFDGIQLLILIPMALRLMGRASIW